MRKMLPRLKKFFLTLADAFDEMSTLDPMDAVSLGARSRDILFARMSCQYRFR